MLFVGEFIDGVILVKTYKSVLFYQLPRTPNRPTKSPIPFSSRDIGSIDLV
jgi:hypothetical protein